MDSQQMSASICRRTGAYRPAVMLISFMMLMGMSGCASMTTGWQPVGKHRAAAPMQKMHVQPYGADMWERPDGSAVQAPAMQQPQQRRQPGKADLEEMLARSGQAVQPHASDQGSEVNALESDIYKQRIGQGLIYRLGVGDQVSITIWGYEKLSRVTRIKDDGTIFAPYVGNIKLAGLTLVEAQQYLTERYRAYIRSPQLDMDIAEYSSKKLFLIGDLEIFKRAQMVTGGKAEQFSPAGQNRQQLASSLGALSGIYGFGGSGNIGVAKNGSKVNNFAENSKQSVGEPISRVVPIRGKVTLFEAMLELDTLSADVNWYAAYMIRHGKFMDIDFHRLMEIGDRRTDVMLDDRDILFLPSNKDQKVFVLGEVGAPTIVPLHKGQLSLVDALTRAGYVSSTAKKEDVKVIRGGMGNPMMRTINLEALEQGDARLNIPLQAGDIVYVPDSFIGKLNDVLVKIAPSMNMILQTLAIYTIGKTLGR